MKPKERRRFTISCLFHLLSALHYVCTGMRVYVFVCVYVRALAMRERAYVENALAVAQRRVGAAARASLAVPPARSRAITAVKFEYNCSE